MGIFDLLEFIVKYFEVIRECMESSDLIQDMGHTTIGLLAEPRASICLLSSTRPKFRL
jgi:hypothetical protein